MVKSSFHLFVFLFSADWIFSKPYTSTVHQQHFRSRSFATYSLFIQRNHVCRQQNFFALSFISLTIIFGILTKLSKSVRHNYRVYSSSSLKMKILFDHCTNSWSLVVTDSNNKWGFRLKKPCTLTSMPNCNIQTIFGHNMTAMRDGKNLQEIAQRAFWSSLVMFIWDPSAQVSAVPCSKTDTAVYDCWYLGSLFILVYLPELSIVSFL